MKESAGRFRGISIVRLASRFWARVLPTLALVTLESIADVCFPLFMGLAIDGLLAGDHRGIVALGTLALVSLIVGSARRFHDTRAYAGIYRTTVQELVVRERASGSTVSAISARIHLLTEFVEFLENSAPAILTQAIQLVGILVVVASLDSRVLLACIALLGLVGVQYSWTAKANFRLNAGYNDELERRVRVLTRGDPQALTQHVDAIMRWNIRLSDLETLNYAVVFVGVVALLVYSPLAIVDPATVQYGLAFAAMMYVFQYIELLATLPYFVQQLIRLQEISTRLNASRHISS